MKLFREEKLEGEILRVSAGRRSSREQELAFTVMKFVKKGNTLFF
jgi:hypothetical protein